LEAWVWRITRNAISDYFRKLRPAEPMPDEIQTVHDKPGDEPDLRPCVQQFVKEFRWTIATRCS
jgi:DNA-directed RNA polymerase specialized sigma24 family protein